MELRSWSTCLNCSINLHYISYFVYSSSKDSGATTGLSEPELLADVISKTIPSICICIVHVLLIHYFVIAESVPYSPKCSEIPAIFKYPILVTYAYVVKPHVLRMLMILGAITVIKHLNILNIKNRFSQKTNTYYTLTYTLWQYGDLLFAAMLQNNVVKLKTKSLAIFSFNDLTAM